MKRKVLFFLISALIGYQMTRKKEAKIRKFHLLMPNGEAISFDTLEEAKGWVKTVQDMGSE